MSSCSFFVELLPSAPVPILASSRSAPHLRRCIWVWGWWEAACGWSAALLNIPSHLLCCSLFFSTAQPVRFLLASPRLPPQPCSSLLTKFPCSSTSKSADDSRDANSGRKAESRTVSRLMLLSKFVPLSLPLSHCLCLLPPCRSYASKFAAAHCSLTRLTERSYTVRADSALEAIKYTSSM